MKKERDKAPPMPQTQEQWEIHWAFYLLTVEQRDAAWREIGILKALK